MCAFPFPRLTCFVFHFSSSVCAYAYFVFASQQAPFAQLSVLEGHVRAVTSLIFVSANGMLWSASEDCTIRIWNTGTNNCEHTITRECRIGRIVFRVLWWQQFLHGFHVSPIWFSSVPRSHLFGSATLGGISPVQLYHYSGDLICSVLLYSVKFYCIWCS